MKSRFIHFLLSNKRAFSQSQLPQILDQLLHDGSALLISCMATANTYCSIITMILTKIIVIIKDKNLVILWDIYEFG